MCLSSMPEHLNTKEKVAANFPDDSEWGPLWKKWCVWSKPYITFGPRDIHWYHRFREWPITLFAWFGEGQIRWENDIIAIKSVNKPIFWYDSQFNRFYLSRIQSWVSWMVQLQWPLFFAVKVGEWFGYIGYKRDADKVYILGAHIGKGAK